MKEIKIKYHNYLCPALNGGKCNCHEPSPNFYIYTEDELKAIAMRQYLQNSELKEKEYDQKNERENS